MDKETLSNYGWIVICVLVLAVMIALATPFGSYISTAVKSTTQGLFDTNKNALNSTGLINIGDQSFSDGTGGSGGGNQTTEVKREAGSVIPDGATYTPNGGTTLIGNGTNTFPATPQTGDTYEEGDYIYKYNQWFDGDDDWNIKESQNGWGVRVKDTSKTTYGVIISEIAGKSITNMTNTFKNCTSLTTAPTIPNSVTNMSCTFWYCGALTTAPTIPSSVTGMHYTFASCTSLTTATTIPSSVTDMSYTFYRCTSLTAVPTIPSSVTNMEYAFFDCESLTTPPDMSNANSVTNMSSTFTCTSLTTAPVIPTSVTNMSYTFQGCTQLTTAPTIPNSVTNMSFTFSRCTSLTTAPVIPNSVTNMQNTFGVCTSLTTAPTIPSSVTNMEYTFASCTSLTDTIEVNANPSHYTECLKNTQITEVTGSTTLKAEILATK